MKQIILPLLSIVILAGCKKESNENTTSLKEYNDNMKSQVQKIGKAHNASLRFAELVLSKKKVIMQNSDDLYKNVETIVDLTSQGLVDQGFSLENISLTEVKENLYQAIKDSSYDAPIERVWTPIKEHPEYETSIDQKEREFVEKVWGVFNKDYTNYLPESCYNDMRNQLQQIIIEFENTIWPTGTGDYCGGLIYTTSSSLDYWWDFYLRNESGTLGIGQNGVLGSISKWLRRASAAQCDAAGYIVGWADSWLIDEEENSSVRIKRGLVNAASWSGFSLNK